MPPTMCWLRIAPRVVLADVVVAAGGGDAAQAVELLDDARLGPAARRGQRSRHARRPAADDEDVDLIEDRDFGVDFAYGLHDLFLFTTKTPRHEDAHELHGSESLCVRAFGVHVILVSLFRGGRYPFTPDDTTLCTKYLLTNTNRIISGIVPKTAAAMIAG